MMKLNATEQRIFGIIRSDVCGQCGTSWDGNCEDHRERCEAGYERQAKKIYWQIVRPLVDELQKERLNRGLDNQG